MLCELPHHALCAAERVFQFFEKEPVFTQFRPPEALFWPPTAHSEVKARCSRHQATHPEGRGRVSRVFVLLTQKAASGRCGNVSNFASFLFNTCVSSTTPEDSQKSTTTKLTNLPRHLEHDTTRSCRNGCRLTSSRTRTENALPNHPVDRVFIPNAPTFVK